MPWCSTRVRVYVCRLKSCTMNWRRPSWMRTIATLRNGSCNHGWQLPQPVHEATAICTAPEPPEPPVGVVRTAWVLARLHALRSSAADVTARKYHVCTVRYVSSMRQGHHYSSPENLQTVVQRSSSGVSMVGAVQDPRFLLAKVQAISCLHQMLGS